MHLKKLSVWLGCWSVIGVGTLCADPTIQSFSPAFGSASDPTPIIINGSGFSSGTLVVKFNGVTDLTAGVTDANGTIIQAQVPAGATNGPNPIYVSVGGVGTSSAQDFTVIGPGPYITGFSPAVGGGGAGVTINGAHFTNPLTVKFNSAPAPLTSSADGTSISATAPSGVTSGPISVTTAAGNYTTSSNFFGQPVLTGFSPAAGRSGTNVVITGTNFLGATAVRFNGFDATSFTVLSNRAVQATVPAGATTGLLRVITPTASIFSTSNFVVQPTISGFSPAFGPVGTSVTITGANFTNGTPVVKFNGVQAATPTGVTFNQLTAVVPAGATTGPITVTNLNGSATTLTNFFLPASITSLSTNQGPVGTLIALTGVNFLGATALAFNGTPAFAFYLTNNTSLGAVVPFGVTSGTLGITTPAGTTNSTVKFYVPPSITGFAPTHGLPGTNVTIFGQNLLDATVVRFNGSNATVSVVNNTTINTTVPTGAQTGPITVIAPAGTNTSAQNFLLDYTANLSVTVSDAPDPVLAGSNLTYTITIANSGPYAAPGVTLTDTLIGPALLTAATTTQGTLITNTSPITGSLGQIGVGGNVVVMLTVVPQAEVTITNIASVASQYADPAPENNSATNTTLVQPLPLLTIRRVSDRVRITWNAALTNYGLEFNSTLPAVNQWSNLTTLPNLVGSEYQLTETNNLPMHYYRLHRVP